MKKIKKVLLLQLILILNVSYANAAIFNNGFANDFSETSLGNNVVKNSSAGDVTSLNVLDGGRFGNLTALDFSRVNVFSGAIIDGRLLGSDSSIINIFGGSIGLVDAGGESSLSITDGTIDLGVRGFNNAVIKVTGGVFSSNGSSSNAISVSQNSEIEIRGGEFNGRLYLAGTTADIFGGTFSELFNLGITTIYGSNFNLPYGEIVGNLAPTVLTGSLADGSFLNATISQGGGKIVLAPVPLPGAIVMFISGLIGIFSIKRNSTPVSTA